MFVDASAIVAILLAEPGFERLAERLKTCERPLTSSLALYEAVLACARATPDFAEVERAVWTFVDLVSLHIVPIDERMSRSAMTAFQRYGKGRGHPARLNLGDGFA